jgi:hypothetical protein
LRNLSHVEGVVGGGSACAEFQRARVDDLTSALPMKHGSRSSGVSRRGTPHREGLQAPMGSRAPEPFASFFNQGRPFERSILPLIARGPVRAAAARPGGASRRLRRWGEGRAPPRSRCSAPVFGKIARGRPSGDPQQSRLRSDLIRLCSNGNRPGGQGSGERIECHQG